MIKTQHINRIILISICACYIGASRSGYYRWRRQPQSKRQKDNEKILIEIKESHLPKRRECDPY
jgi:hypothetical protein